MSAGKVLLRIAIVILALGMLTGLSVLTAVCVCAGADYEPRPSDCIVALGAHVWMDGRMSNVLTYRCQAALEAWQRGIAPVIVVCGGQGRDDPCPEAEAMQAWMLRQGVPEDALIVENQSLNTKQNLTNALAIMEARGFQTAALCTSDYHLRRTLWLARDVGMQATGIAAPSTKDVVSVVRGRLRETCSWVLYFVRKVTGIE